MTIYEGKADQVWLDRRPRMGQVRTWTDVDRVKLRFGRTWTTKTLSMQNPTRH